VTVISGRRTGETALPLKSSQPRVREEIGVVAHGASSRGGLQARLVEAVDDVAVWDRWSALEQTGIATAFQSRAFIEPLIRRLAPALGGRGVVVEVTGRSGPVLMAAFTLRRRRGITYVELAECGLSDYAAPLFRPGVADDAAQLAALERAVFAALPPHDVLFLRKMPERIGGHANPFASFSGARSMCTGTITVDPAEIVAGRGAVKEGERKARRIVREGGRVRRIADHAEALAALEQLFAFRGARADAAGYKDKLNQPAVRDFYREVIGGGLRSGFAAIYEIAAADRLLGVVQGFVYRGRFHGTLMGFAADDPLSAAVSPGLVGVVHALADHAKTGGTAFDFGAGEHPYKARFGGIASDYRQLARAVTVRGLAPLAVDIARRESRRAVREHPALGMRLRRWRDFLAERRLTPPG
jgi:CelD/BcsL family acetyltransferase involved in cellulose biosynthesis